MEIAYEPIGPEVDTLPDLDGHRLKIQLVRDLCKAADEAAEKHGVQSLYDSRMSGGLTISIFHLFLYLWLNKKIDEIGENLNRQARSLLSACYPLEGESLLASGQENARKETDLQENIT